MTRRRAVQEGLVSHNTTVFSKLVLHSLVLPNLLNEGLVYEYLFISYFKIYIIKFDLLFQTINQWSNAVSSPNLRIIFL